MATGAEIDRLVEGVLSGRLDRRQLMTAAAALGIAVPGALAMRAAPAMAQEASPIPKSGGSLTAIIVDDPNLLDILVTQLAQVRNIMESVYDTLTYLDAADPSFAIKGRLAKEWSFPEELVFELKLQEGVTFHNGRGFYRRRCEMDLRVRQESRHRLAERAIPGASRFGRSGRSADRAHLILNKPWAAIPVDLSHHSDLFEDRPLPTRSLPLRMAPAPSSGRNGCRAITSRSPRTRITGSPGEPYLDEIVFRPIKEKATSLAVMQAGDADVFFTPELKDKATIDGDPNLKSIASLLNDRATSSTQQLPGSDERPEYPPGGAYALDRPTYFHAFLAGPGREEHQPLDEDALGLQPDQRHRIRIRPR